MASENLAVGIDDRDDRNRRVKHRANVIGKDTELLFAGTVEKTASTQD
jgi:hypothetical protein